MLIVNKTELRLKIVCKQGSLPLEQSQLKPGKREDFLGEVKTFPEKIVFREVREDPSDFSIRKDIPTTFRRGNFSVVIKCITDLK